MNSLIGWTAPNGAKVIEENARHLDGGGEGVVEVKFDKYPCKPDSHWYSYKADGSGSSSFVAHKYPALKPPVPVVEERPLINMTDKYVRRHDGKPVRILAIDLEGNLPVVFSCGSIVVQSYADGRYHPDRDDGRDIILAPAPNVVSYSAIYRAANGGEYDSIASIPKNEGRIGVVRITRSPDKTKLISVEIAE